MPLQTLGWPYAWCIVFSLGLMCVVGMVVERGLMRPLQHAPHISLAMMTVALSYLFKGISRFFHGREVVALPPLLTGEPMFFGDVVLLPQDLLIMGLVLVIVAVFFIFFQQTEIGKVIEAASRHPRGALLSGINVPLLRNLMWGVGAAMGALAGILIAPNTLVYPDMGGHMLVRGFAAMTLGGFGSLPGAMLGSILLGIFENLAGGYLSSALVDITAYLVIIIVLLIRPQGLLNWRRDRD